MKLHNEKVLFQKQVITTDVNYRGKFPNALDEFIDNVQEQSIQFYTSEQFRTIHFQFTYLLFKIALSKKFDFFDKSHDIINDSSFVFSKTPKSFSISTPPNFEQSL